MTQCTNCDKQEYNYKTIMLEDHNWVCSNCYYTAQEETGKSLMTLDDVRDSKLNEEALKQVRRRYLSIVRKYCQHLGSPIVETLNKFAHIEHKFIKETFSKRFKDLTLTELKKSSLHMIQHIPYYFGIKLDTQTLKNIKLKDYYLNKDYEAKIRRLR